MILVFGGAYQGKLDFALSLLKASENEISENAISENAISENEILRLDENLETADFKDIKVVYGLENLVMACTKAGIEAKEFLASKETELKDAIIVAADVSQGLVPMDPTERAFREMMGRTMLYLAPKADSVYRVFCGLGTKIK